MGHTCGRLWKNCLHQSKPRAADCLLRLHKADFLFSFMKNDSCCHKVRSFAVSSAIYLAFLVVTERSLPIAPKEKEKPFELKFKHGLGISV